MIRFAQNFLLCVFILPVFIVHGQNNCLNKKVSLPTGQIALKVALNSISNQTGCVFSYDPTKIPDNQLLNIHAKGTQSLNTILLEILPKNIQFKLNGKYIVLQESTNKNSVTPESKTAKPSKQNKSTNTSQKSNGLINKNPVLEQLVLPPLENNSDTKFVTREVETIKNQGTDSLKVTQNTLPFQSKDSITLVDKIEDSVSKKQVLTNVTQASDSKLALNNTSDTTKIIKSRFGDFIKRNGYLEIGASINNQIGAFSINLGLYDFYTILSIGSDYNDSYLFGFGAGANIKIDKHFSVNCDLLQSSLIAGKSYSLQVRASNTQLIPVMNYSISSFKFFAGPTVNLIKSSYVSSISSTDLGLLVGIGFSFGVKVDLKNLFFKQI